MSTWIPLKIADLALDEKDKEIAALKAELTDLKSTADRFEAEVDSLMTNPTSRLLRAEREENARLKAEVENSKRINTELLVLSNRQASDIRRLTKAGDDLAANIGNDERSQDICADAWNAAKEDKQS